VLLEVVFELLNLDGFISELVNKTRIIYKHIIYICRYYLYSYSNPNNDKYLQEHQRVYVTAFKLCCKLLILIPSKLTEKGVSWVVLENLFCSSNCLRSLNSSEVNLGDLDSNELLNLFITQYPHFHTRQLAFLTVFKLVESVPERMIPKFESFLPQPLFDKLCYF